MSDIPGGLLIDSFFFPRFPAMRRTAEDALLHAGDQLPEDPRPSKAIPQPSKTRTITVHNLPIQGCEDGVTSLEMGLGKTVQAAVAVESACRTLGCL